jgi:hypothetical protein
MGKNDSIYVAAPWDGRKRHGAAAAKGGLQPDSHSLARWNRPMRPSRWVSSKPHYLTQMLVFNFNSTKEDFPKYEEQLRKSMNSICISSQESEQD